MHALDCDTVGLAEPRERRVLDKAVQIDFCETLCGLAEPRERRAEPKIAKPALWSSAAAGKRHVFGKHQWDQPSVSVNGCVSVSAK